MARVRKSELPNSVKQPAELAMPKPIRAGSMNATSLKKIRDSSLVPHFDEWHEEAFVCHREIPEVGALVNAVASGVSACRLRVGIENARGEVKETQDPRAIRVLSALVGPMGGREELLRTAASLMEISGDSYFLGTQVQEDLPDGTTAYTDEWIWEFLSTREITYAKPKRKGERGTITRNSDGGGAKTTYASVGKQQGEILSPDHTYIARFWRRDLEFSNRSDCALRKALLVCDELIRLTELVKAVANARLNAGIIFIPEEMSFGPADDTMEPGEEQEEFDAFTKELGEQFTAPAEDYTSAAAVVPFIMRGNGEMGKFIQYLTFDREFDRVAMELRAEAIDRIASTMSAPKETLEGKSNANHWSGVNIDSEFATKTILPLGRSISSFLTVAYLRVMLAKFEGMSPEIASRYHIIFDPSPIIARTDKATLACTLWEKGNISEDALRRHTGFDESDAPSVNERRQTLILDLIRAAPVSLGPLLVGKVNGLEDVEEKLIEIEIEKARVSGGNGPDDPDNPRARDREDEQDRRENDDGEPDRTPGTEPEPVTGNDSAAIAAIVSTSIDVFREEMAKQIVEVFEARNSKLHEVFEGLDPQDVLNLLRPDELAAEGVDLKIIAAPHLSGLNEILLSEFHSVDPSCIEAIMDIVFNILTKNFLNPPEVDTNGLYVSIGTVQVITGGSHANR